MRSFKTLPGISAGVLLALAGAAQAAIVQDSFEVTATVVASCSVIATDMSFGNFDGSADLTATSTIDVTCTDDHAYQVALDAGSAAGSTIASRLLTNGSDTLAYNLYTDGAHTNIWGDTAADDVDGVGTGLATPVTHTVFGELPAAGNENASTGNYASTITVTVTY
jgi:spore coat protein U-like protein